MPHCFSAHGGAESVVAFFFLFFYFSSTAHCSLGSGAVVVSACFRLLRAAARPRLRVLQGGGAPAAWLRPLGGRGSGRLPQQPWHRHPAPFPDRWPVAGGSGTAPG